MLGNRTDFRTVHPDWTSLPQLFKENGYVTVPRRARSYHGGIDDPKAWSVGGGVLDGDGGAGGRYAW